MKNKFVILGLISAAAYFLWDRNNRRIAELRLKLLEYQNKTPQRGSSAWDDYINIALQIYGSVSALFAPGGPFSRSGSPSQTDVLYFLNKNQYKYDV